MSPIEKLNKLFGSLDCVTFTKRYEYLCPKDTNPDLPSSFEADLKLYLESGEFPDRNPLPWVLFCEKKNVKVGDETWRNAILNYYRIFSDPEISELDNERNHVFLEVEFDVLAENARSMPENAFEDVECVVVKTQIGEFQIVPEPEDDME